MNKAIFDSLTRLYLAAKITAAGIHVAVEREWISPEQYQAITGESYLDD